MVPPTGGATEQRRRLVGRIRSRSTMPVRVGLLRGPTSQQPRESAGFPRERGVGGRKGAPAGVGQWRASQRRARVWTLSVDGSGGSALCTSRTNHHATHRD